jgi:hypothetical protein
MSFQLSAPQMTTAIVINTMSSKRRYLHLSILGSSISVKKSIGAFIVFQESNSDFKHLVYLISNSYNQMPVNIYNVFALS